MFVFDWIVRRYPDAAASWLWCLLVLASPLKIVFYVTAMARLIVRQRRVSFLFAAAASGLYGGGTPFDGRIVERGGGAVFVF